MKTVKFQLLAPWVVFNYGPGKGVSIFKLHYEEEENLERTAKVYGILVKEAGFEGIPEGHIHDRFGIPKPQAGEKTLRFRQANEPDTAAVEKTAHKAIVPSGTHSLIAAQEYIDSLADDATASGVIDLTTFEEIVDAAVSYEDLQEKLADIYQGIDTTRFREVIESAMTLAGLKGRSLE